MTDSDLGKILRANVERLLAERDLTASEFRQQMGISRQVYSQMFTREPTERLKKLQTWADALGVPLSELMKEEGE